MERQKTKVTGVLLRGKKKKRVSKSNQKEPSSDDCFFRFFTHPLFLALRLLNSVTVTSPLVLLYWFFLRDMLQGPLLLFCALTIIVIMFGFMARSYVFWRINSYLMDDRGLAILAHPSLFSDELERVPIERISVTEADQSGFFPVVLNYGDLIISSIITQKKGAANVILKRIYNPDETLRKIQYVCDTCEDLSPSQKREVLHDEELDPSISES